MTRKEPTKPKLTDAERHKRFVAMARDVEASEDPADFDKAFKAVAPRRPSVLAKKPDSGGGRKTSAPRA